MKRQLTAAQAKYRDFEDTTLELEREKNAQDRQLETQNLHSEELAPLLDDNVRLNYLILTIHHDCHL